MAKKPLVKQTPVECSIQDAMDYAYGVVEELRDEIEESLDNQRDHPGMSATQRFQTMEENVDSLGSITDEKPDWPSQLDEVTLNPVKYYENRDKRISRAGRRDNASAALWAAVNELRDWADTQETALETDEEERTDEQVKLLMDRELDGIREQIDEARQVADIMEEHQETIDGLEFPGQRG